MQAVVKYNNNNLISLMHSVLGGHCAIYNPFNLLRLRSAQVLIDNLFRCHKKVPDGCVVSCGQKSNDSKFHVENVGLNNGFGGRHNV